MPYLTDLAAACRKSGLNVVEVAGWKTRGHGPMVSVDTIVCHHTATPDRYSGNYPTLRVVRDGRPGLNGPLAQLGLGRDGTVYVIAAGKSWHAGKTALLRQGNSRAIGIEAEASGARPIEGVQLTAYLQLVRALMDHYNVPVSHVESHGEVAIPRGRKNDIRNNMDDFRRMLVGGKTGPGMSASVAIPKVPASTPTEPRGPFPLPKGHWYGTNDGSSRSHSGFQAKDRGAIKLIQMKLGFKGKDVDGKYGPATERNVRAWQKKHNLGVDGKVGPATWRSM